MIQFTALITATLLAAITPSDPDEVILERPMSAGSLMNAWRADFGAAQMQVPGGSVMNPVQAETVAICYRRLVDAIGDEARFYLAAFGGPYTEDLSGFIDGVEFYSSQYQFFVADDTPKDFNAFLRLHPRYTCGLHGGGLAVGRVIGSIGQIEWIESADR